MRRRRAAAGGAGPGRFAGDAGRDRLYVRRDRRRKGVMLSHRDVVSNVLSVLKQVRPSADDVFLSFLPLSRTFERTAAIIFLSRPAAGSLTRARFRSSATTCRRSTRPSSSRCRASSAAYAAIRSALAKKSGSPARCSTGPSAWAGGGSWPQDAAPPSPLVLALMPILDRAVAATSGLSRRPAQPGDRRRRADAVRRVALLLAMASTSCRATA